MIKNVWDFSTAVREQYLVEVTYKKERKTEIVKRILEPLGVIFSEYYFYLIGSISGKNYDFPTVYRIDRIQEYTILDKKFTISHAKRFAEGT